MPQPMFGVVGALYILQGATYLYESLFGNIQPSKAKESDASLSVEDDYCGPADFANLTPKQRIRLKAERYKLVLTSGASFKGKSKEGTPESHPTSLAVVTTGACSSSDPVKEISQARPAQATTKHQGASQFKGKSIRGTPEEHSTSLAKVTIGECSSSDPVKEISQARPAQATTKHQGASRCKGESTGGTPEEHSTSLAEVTTGSCPSSSDSVQEISRARPAQATTKHQGASHYKGESIGGTPEEHSTSLAEVTTGTCPSSDSVKEISQARPAQATTKHQGASHSKDQPKTKFIQEEQDLEKEQQSASSASSKTQAKNLSTLIVQGPTSATKEEGNREGSKIQSSNFANKSSTTTPVKGQNIKQSTSQVQEPTCDAAVQESIGQGKDPNRYNCDSAEKNVLTTSRKEALKKQPVKTIVPLTSYKETKKQSSQKDEGPTSGALVGKEERKGKDQKKHTSDSAMKNVPTTSFKEHPMRQASLQHHYPVCEAEICKKGGKVMEPKKGSCDNARNDVPTTSSKEQPKKELTHKDQELTSGAENAKAGCKKKEPKKHTCVNAKKSVPGTSSEGHRQRNSTPQDEIPTCETHTGKKGSKAEEPKTHRCDDVKKNVSITSCKEQPKKQFTQKDEGHTQDATAAQKGWNGEAKKSSTGSARKFDPNTTSKEHADNQTPQEDKGPAGKAQSGTKRYKGEDTVKKPVICKNPEKCVSTTSIKMQPKEKQGLCENSAGKNKGKGKEPKKCNLDNIKDIDGPTTSHSKQLKQEPTQKDKGPNCVADARKKEGKAQGVKSETEKELSASVIPNQCTAKMVETPCLPGNSQDVTEHCANSIKASKSEWTLVGKNTNNNKKKRKAGPSDKYEAGPKKPTVSQMRVVKKTTSKSSEEPSQSKPGDKDQKSDEPPKKKRPTRRAKKKPKKGKLTSSDAVTARNQASPVTIQEHCPTNTEEAPRAVANTWANIVKSRPNINTPPLPSDSKAPEIQGEETHKVTTLGKCEMQTAWNVPVTYKKSIGHKKKALCVNQPTEIPITHGEERKDSVRPGTEKPISALHVKQEEELLSMDSFNPNFPVKLVEEREEELQKKSAEHHNADSPITQKAAVTDFFRPGTERSISAPLVKQEEVLHLKDLVIPNFPVKLVEERENEEALTEYYNAASGIPQEAGMKDSVRPGTEIPISAPLVKEEEGLHLIDLVIPNFPVKLVEEREEEVEKTPTEHHNAGLPISPEAQVKDSVRPGTEKPISAPLVRQEARLHLMDSFISNFPIKLEEERENDKTSIEYHNAASPITREAGMKVSIASGQKPILAQHVQQGEELHRFDSFIPNHPVKVEEEREEEEKASTEHHDAVLPMSKHEMCTIIPTETNILMQDKSKDMPKTVSVLVTTATQTGEPATSSRICPAVLEPLDQIRLTDQAACREILTSTSNQTDEHVPQTVKSVKSAASVQQEPTDQWLTAKSEGLKSVPKTSTQGAPNRDFSKMSALSPAFVPRSTSPAVNPQTTLVKYVQDPTTQAVNSLMAEKSGQSDRMLTVKSQVQRSLPVRYVQEMPTTNQTQMSAFSPAYSLYQFSPVVQQQGNTFPAVNPPTLVRYIDGPTTLQCGTTYYQNYNYPVPATETWQTGYELTPYNAYRTYVPVHQRAVLSPMVEPYMQTTFPVVPLGVALTTNAVLPSSTCTAMATLVQPRKQQPYITPDVKQVQKPNQVTSSKVEPTIYRPLKTAPSSTATETPKAAAAPLKQQLTSTTPTVKQAVQKPNQVTFSEAVTTINAPLETSSPAATETLKAAAPLKQQLTNTSPAVKHAVQKPNQVTSSKAVTTVNTPLEASSPAATETPKAAAPLKQQLTNMTRAVEQAMQKPNQVTSPEAVTTINAPLETSSPAATETPKAAAPLKQQLNNTSPAVKLVVQKPNQVTSSEASATINALLETASPAATETPKAKAPLKQQLTNTAPAVKQVVQKTNQVTSSKPVTTIHTSLEEASSSATKISKAVAPPKEQLTSGTPAVKKVGQKSDKVKSSKDMPTTNAPLEEASPFATKTPKAASTDNHLQTTNTPVREQEVHEPGQDMYPMVLNATTTSQEQTTSVTSNEQTPETTMVKQSDNTCHSLSEVTTYSRSVRPKERGPVATPSSSKVVEISAINQTNLTATGPKNSRLARRRRARGRQRERKRLEKAEKRAAEAEKKAATETEEGAAALVEKTEGADSSNHHVEIASSSSSEIILNFDDDSEFVIDWEAEAAKPFYNSTEIFPPRVEIPEWAQWDFSQNERLQQLGQENHYK